MYKRKFGFAFRGAKRAGQGAAKAPKTYFRTDFSATKSRMQTAAKRRMILATSRTGPEIKSVDFPVHASSPLVQVIGTTAGFLLLNGIQEGASFYNRVGRRIHMKSINIQGQLQNSSGNGTGVPEFLRIMLIYDRQPNGAAPAISDILLDYDNAGTTTTNNFSRLNPNNWERFLMLRDWKIQIPNNVGGTAGVGNDLAIMNYAEQGKFNEHVKLDNLETHFKSSSNPAAIGDISTGALFLVTYGGIANASAGYEIAFTGRLRYLDV